MCSVHGPNTVAQFVGLNATGRAFNSVAAIEDRIDGRTNPMVNPGAIATASMTHSRIVASCFHTGVKEDVRLNGDGAFHVFLARVDQAAEGTSLLRRKCP